MCGSQDEHAAAYAGGEEKPTELAFERKRQEG
jgi:hypothetical protein